MSRRRKVVITALAVLVPVVVAAFAAALTRGGHESVKQERMWEARMLLKNVASPGRFDKAGPGEEAERSGGKSPAAEEYENRAFPNANIAFAQTESSIKAARQILKHTGTKFPKPWEAIGPETLNVDPPRKKR